MRRRGVGLEGAHRRLPVRAHLRVDHDAGNPRAGGRGQLGRAGNLAHAVAECPRRIGNLNAEEQIRNQQEHLAHRYFRCRTGTQRLVGCDALVLERTTGDAGVIKLEGEQWTARAYDNDEVFEPGQRVQVVQIKGATALVTE